MASSSDVEMVPKWEVGPTEDVIQALMETLVEPLLPLTVADVPPQEDDQISVAKQMHAVVMLYNYYHRKQKPELRFLDFVSFCKLAATLKPPLVSFMKLMKESEPNNYDIAHNIHLSITEKAIKGACDIALALDASGEFPIIDGWPISRVAVLLIDSKKKNCMLRFSDVTNGVWSLIEKEIKEPKICPEMLSGEKTGDKRKRNSFKTFIYDKDFLNLAYDVVKDVTGIGSGDLKHLGAHVTYSLSQEKSTVRFYMMQCSESFDVKEEVSLKLLVESLQGPLVEKLDDGFWKTTMAIEFYHMLPYVDFISCWLSGKEICLNSHKKELTQTVPTLDLPPPKNSSSGSDTDKNVSGPEVSSSEIIATENRAENEKVKSLVSHFQSTATDGNDTDIDSEAKNKKCRVGIEVSDTDSEKMVIDDNAIEKFKNVCGIVILAKDSDECGSEKTNTDELTTKTCTKSEDMSTTNPSSKIKVYHHRKKNNSLAQNDACVREDGDNLKVNNVDSLTLHHAELGNETVVSEDKGDVTISCADLGNETVVSEDKGDVTISCANLGNETVVSEDKGDVTISCAELGNETVVSEDKGDVTILCDDPNVIASNVNELVQLEDENLELQNVSASEKLEMALALVNRRRQELYTQLCNMEDTLAYYENDIDRLPGGGEAGLARKIIKSILTGSYHPMLKHGTQNGDDEGNNVKAQREKQTGLFEIYLPGKSSCQDLEYACIRNNWRLPKYYVKPSDGKFVSEVFIHVKDMKLHSKGGYESRPSEARESAAAQMIAELRILYGK